MPVVRYPYKDPKEMSAFKVINEGDGFFKIMEISSKLSKRGQEMLVMLCKLRDKSGNETLYNHYIMYNEYMPDNIYRICEAIGKLDLYRDTGTNTEDLLGSAGRCKIKTDDSDYGKQSKIHRFIAHQNVLEDEPEPEPELIPHDDEVPF
jgi:hypothetical protein